MLREISENVPVMVRNKLNQHQHRHFHPSSSLHPSKEDTVITDKLINAWWADLWN